MDKNVPDIRFCGYSGEWEDKKFKDIVANLSGGASIAPNDYQNNGKRTIPKGAVNDTGVADLSGSKCVSIDFYEKNILSKASSGDLVTSLRDLVPTAPNMGRVVKIRSPKEDFLMPQGVYKIELVNGVDENFVIAYSNSEIFRKIISREKNGSTQVHIRNGEFLDIEVIKPKSEEQTQIGNYFQKLDNLINQHQQKHDKLSNIKKAMLEKMFPKQGETVPEIRFKGFGGEWEVRPFGICFANIPNNTLSRADLNYETGLAQNIHYGDVLIKFGEILDLRKEVLPFISSDVVANKLKHAALQNGDIIIADAAEDDTVGKCTELFNIDEQLILSGLHTIAVRPTLPFASKYLGYYLNSTSYHDQLLSLMQGTKVLSISKTAIQNTNVIFPKRLEEQIQIGNCFQTLDTLINQHQQQITKLNNIKQACLSKMFV